MNSFDFILLGILLVFVVIGAWRGFVREILSLVTWGAAILVGWLFADDLAGLYDALVEDDVVRRVLAFVTLFAVVFLSGMLVSLLANRFLLQKKAFRTANVVFGGLFGAVRGGLVVTLAFLLAGVTSFRSATGGARRCFRRISSARRSSPVSTSRGILPGISAYG